MEHHDRDRVGRLTHGDGCGHGGSNDDIHLRVRELSRELLQALRVALGEPLIDDDRLAFDVAELPQALPKDGHVLLR